MRKSILKTISYTEIHTDNNNPKSSLLKNNLYL